jgi:hypothetical protein
MLNSWDDTPQGTICPEKLNKKGLFSLNTDSAIWKGLWLLEAGLGSDHAPPRWLADEVMCLAIIAHLDFQGCEVELNIIMCEVQNMCIWYTEECLAIQAAMWDAGVVLIVLIWDLNFTHYDSNKSHTSISSPMKAILTPRAWCGLGFLSHTITFLHHITGGLLHAC